MRECWLYDGTLSSDGYGKFGGALVHRLSYEALVGSIPSGLEIDHLCRNRSCYNPAHLEPVTHAENKRRAAEARKTCVHGHPFDAANTYVASGRRRCRACNRLSARKYKENRK